MIDDILFLYFYGEGGGRRVSPLHIVFFTHINRTARHSAPHRKEKVMDIGS